MTTFAFAEPYTIRRYLELAAADLRLYFPAATVVVAGGVGAEEHPGDHIRLRLVGVGQVTAGMMAYADSMRVDIQAEIYWTGLDSLDVVAQVYAWVFRRGSAPYGEDVTVDWEFYGPERNSTFYKVGWQIIMPNDYTLRPLEGPGQPLRSITMELQTIDESPLGTLVVD